VKRILRNAHQVGPIKGHPLRTDFSRVLSGKERILIAGEAIGLVHPITGEGIDYALESGQLAAEAILEGWQNGLSSQAIQRKYRAALGKNFSFGFALALFLQRVFFRDGFVDKTLCRIQRRPYLHRALVEFCFDRINPITVFTPQTLWGVFKPWD
jgi:flavin-dependent dehydrogenase